MEIWETVVSSKRQDRGLWEGTYKAGEKKGGGGVGKKKKPGDRGVRKKGPGNNTAPGLSPGCGAFALASGENGKRGSNGVGGASKNREGGATHLNPWYRAKSPYDDGETNGVASRKKNAGAKGKGGRGGEKRMWFQTPNRGEKKGGEKEVVRVPRGGEKNRRIERHSFGEASA